MPIKRGFAEEASAAEPGAEGSPARPTGATSTQPEEEPRKPAKRRTKDELIADAEVPNDDVEVTVVFEETGQTEKRLWPEAVALRRQGKVKLSRALEYAFLKLERQEEEKLAAEDREFDGEKPPIPQLDDEFDITLRVQEPGGGFKDTPTRWTWRAIVKHVVFEHNTNLTGPPEVMEALTWIQSEKGKPDAPAPPPAEADRQPGPPPAEPPATEPAPQPVVASATPATRDEVVLGASGRPLVKVTMGYLEKIGLPEYSSLAIGPASVTRYVEDTGEMMEVERSDGSKILVNKSVFDAMQQCAQDCEAVMRAERQAMIAFLEATRPGSTQS